MLYEITIEQKHFYIFFLAKPSRTLVWFVDTGCVLRTSVFWGRCNHIVCF